MIVMNDYPYLQSKINYGTSEIRNMAQLGRSINQPGLQGFIVSSPSEPREHHNYSYYTHLENKMKSKSKNRLDNNLRLVKNYKERRNIEPITLQCRNTYELKMIHEECGRLNLKHETVRLENVYQNKLRSIKCTICDDDCRCTKSTKAISDRKPIYGVKICKVLAQNLRMDKH